MRSVYSTGCQDPKVKVKIAYCLRCRHRFAIKIYGLMRTQNFRSTRSLSVSHVSSVCLCLSVCDPDISLSISVSTGLHVFIFIYLFIILPDGSQTYGYTNAEIYMSFSTCVCVRPSVHISLYVTVSVCLSVCPSVSVHDCIYILAVPRTNTQLGDRSFSVREFGTVYLPHCGSLTLNLDTLYDF